MSKQAKKIVDKIDSVKICGVNHKIIMKTALEMPNELGLCHSDIQEIWLNKTNTRETNLNVLLHECLHTISDVYDLDLSERQVSVLATALIAFARDNPNVASTVFNSTTEQGNNGEEDFL